MANLDETADCGKDSREPTLVKNGLSSCLKDSNKSPKRQVANRSVSFPKDDSQIVTGYLEPVNPWEYGEFLINTLPSAFYCFSLPLTDLGHAFYERKLGRNNKIFKCTLLYYYI